MILLLIILCCRNQTSTVCSFKNGRDVNDRGTSPRSHRAVELSQEFLHQVGQHESEMHQCPALSLGLINGVALGHQLSSSASVS